MARQAHEAYLAAQDYANFIHAHYPEEFVWRGGELTAAVEQVSRSGAVTILLTIGALALDALLLFTRWREAKRRPLAGPAGETGAPGKVGADEPELEITVQALNEPEDVAR
jgi:hypothetical protein